MPFSNQHHGIPSPLLQKFPGQYSQRYKVQLTFLPALSPNSAIKLHFMCESLVRPWLTEFETPSLGHRKSRVFSCSCSSTSPTSSQLPGKKLHCDLYSELCNIQNIWKDKHRTSPLHLPRLQQFVVHHHFKSDMLD